MRRIAAKLTCTGAEGDRCLPQSSKLMRGGPHRLGWVRLPCAPANSRRSDATRPDAGPRATNFVGMETYPPPGRPLADRLRYDEVSAPLSLALRPRSGPRVGARGIESWCSVVRARRSQPARTPRCSPNRPDPASTAPRLRRPRQSPTPTPTPGRAGPGGAASSPPRASSQLD